MEQKEVQFLVIIFSIALFILIVMITTLVTYVQKKKMEFLLSQEREKANYEEQLLKSKVEIAEQSMLNIGWELHDNIGQLLSTASIQVKQLLHNSDDKSDDLRDIKDLIGSSLTQIRSLSKSLNKDLIQDIGLKNALTDEFARITRMCLIETSINMPEEVKVGKGKDIIIFRMIQEFISNTVRHAKARSLTLSATESDNRLTIVIGDDGRGFDTATVVKGNGMYHLVGRADLINADIRIESELNGGTTMYLSIPIETHSL